MAKVFGRHQKDISVSQERVTWRIDQNANAFPLTKNKFRVRFVDKARLGTISETLDTLTTIGTPMLMCFKQLALKVLVDKMRRSDRYDEFNGFKFKQPLAREIGKGWM